MIPIDCKRLAEVDFPIAAVSIHSAADKKTFGYHPQMLSQWWARRPLAACRAMLLGLLLPDPCDEHCPEDFRVKARKLLPRLYPAPGPENTQLRAAILKFIGDFANWDNSSHPGYLTVGRGLVQAAHPGAKPLVVDPFAGGGAIPLEALRVGCEAFASDVNPVAGLILRVMLEDVPREGRDLAEKMRRLGSEIQRRVEAELVDVYSSASHGRQPVAYLWARTVRCESPNCGAEIPLVRSLWLCKKGHRRVVLVPRVEYPPEGVPVVHLDVREPSGGEAIGRGSVTRAKATCLCCKASMSPERVRAQLQDQRGGADVIFDADGRRIGGARLLAVITTMASQSGRHYRPPTDEDYEAVWRAEQQLAEIAGEVLPDGLQAVPNEVLPLMSGTFNVPLYGMDEWGDLFSARQKLVLVRLARAFRELSRTVDTNTEPLVFAYTRVADKNASLVSWDTGRESIGHVFNRQALPMVWDFVESAYVGGVEHFGTNALDILCGVLGNVGLATGNHPGQVELADACKSPLPDDSCDVWFTDPPYYFAVPYADLSDFFFVWLKRLLPDLPTLRDPFDPDNDLTPKGPELCQMAHWDPDRYAHKDQAFFERGMRKAFEEGRRVLSSDGIASVVFAHKTTEGWEALLSGMIGGGWTVTGSWPIATERPDRMRARDSAALATSVHLICRPRPEEAPVGDWADVLRELPRRVGDWMERLQSEGVRGADLVFACIGPALEIYSRYSRVETAAGEEVPLGGDPEAREPEDRGFLAYVWEVIGRSALEQVLGTAEAKARNGAAGALEEDSRLTALFLWTLQSTGSENEGQPSDDTEEADGDEDDEDTGTRSRAKGFSLPYDVARRFAQPLGIHLDEWEDRIINTEKGVVRLLPVAERAKQLFGQDGAQAVAHRIETDAAAAAAPQMTLFPDEAPTVRGRRRTRTQAGAAVSDHDLQTTREATTLDRIHAAMLLQAGGRTNALRALLRAEVDRGPDFVRLANALSALYPMGCEEKRLLDAMLLAVPR